MFRSQEDMPADAIPVPPKAPATRIGSGVIEIVLGNGRGLKARESIDPAVPMCSGIPAAVGLPSALREQLLRDIRIFRARIRLCP